MRKRGCLAVFMFVLFLLAACGEGRERAEEGGVQLWFAADDRMPDYGHGPALDSQPFEGAASPEPEELLAALLAGPTQEGLRSPFPRGVTLRQCQWDEERPGVLLVNMSEQYGALTDVSLSLADYCIVLTLSQVEGVEEVEITAEGRRVSYRSHQLMNETEAVLWDKLAEEGT